jgi:hypothetical protein
MPFLPSINSAIAAACRRNTISLSEFLSIFINYRKLLHQQLSRQHENTIKTRIEKDSSLKALVAAVVSPFSRRRSR